MTSSRSSARTSSPAQAEGNTIVCRGDDAESFTVALKSLLALGFSEPSPSSSTTVIEPVMLTVSTVGTAAEAATAGTSTAPAAAVAIPTTARARLRIDMVFSSGGLPDRATMEGARGGPDAGVRVPQQWGRRLRPVVRSHYGGARIALLHGPRD